MNRDLFLFILFLSIFACKQEVDSNSIDTNAIKVEKTIAEKEIIEIPIANRFDFPVGKPNANGYYNAQAFGKNNHLGDDWNAVTGGNSDLGDPIYAIANGKISYAQDHGIGWGNVVRITHRLPDGTLVESLYAHCDTIIVKENEVIKRGDQIGTIGTANGSYLAHLHFEIRNDLELPVGGGYSNDINGFLDPTVFIENHR